MPDVLQLLFELVGTCIETEMTNIHGTGQMSRTHIDPMRYG